MSNFSSIAPDYERGAVVQRHAAARQRIATTIQSLAADDGLVTLVFHRLYLLAVKL